MEFTFRIQRLNWEIFLGLLSESGEETRKSRLYKLIVEKYPIQFIQKIASTADDCFLSLKEREVAAAVLIEMNDANFLEKNYSKIDMQTLEALRRSARHLMLLQAANEKHSILQMCGEQMTLKLVRLSLEFKQRWIWLLNHVMVDFTSSCSFRPSSSSHLETSLAIFRGLPPHLRDKFVISMKPFIARNRVQFEARLLQLLCEARDVTPFLILPCIIHAFNQTIPPTITQVAIMTSYFSKSSSYRSRYIVRVAEILAQCMEHTRTFWLPYSRINHIISVLASLARLQSTNAKENLVAAVILTEAAKKKSNNCFSLFQGKCRQHKWDEY